MKYVNPFDAVLINIHLQCDFNIDDEFKSSENGNWVVAPRSLGAKHAVPVMSIAIPHKNARAISQH